MVSSLIKGDCDTTKLSFIPQHLERTVMANEDHSTFNMAQDRPTLRGSSHNLTQSSDIQSNWNFFGRAVPKNEIVFATQTLMLYIVIIVCLIDLTRGREDSNLWTALLSSSLGYMLPNPSLKKEKKL